MNATLYADVGTWACGSPNGLMVPASKSTSESGPLKGQTSTRVPMVAVPKTSKPGSTPFPTRVSRDRSYQPIVLSSKNVMSRFGSDVAHAMSLGPPGST